MDRQIWIVGTAGGSKRLLTRQAHAVLKHADVLIADEKQLKAADEYGVPEKAKRITLRMEKLRNILDECIERNIVIFLPYDPGDDPRTNTILKITSGMRPAVIPGVGIRSLLTSRTGIGLSDACAVKLEEHTNLVQLISEHEKLLIFGTGLGSFEKELKAAGLLNTEVYAIEHPGGEDERFTKGVLGELSLTMFVSDSLILLVRKGKLKKPAFKGELGEAFGQNELLMTEEVRSVLMTLLAPGLRETVYIIGAGIGDTAALAALEAGAGHVYAFEKSEYANALSEDVIRKLGIRNLTVVGGEAPLSFGHLPQPDAALIIGCPGIHHELIQILESRNPEIRVVIATKTIETAVRDLDLLEARGMKTSMRLLTVGETIGGRAAHKLRPQESWFILKAECQA